MDDTPPIPPLLICTDGNPLAHNPRWLEDISILASAAADGEIPPFTPLGHHRGDVPCTTDLPAWARPEVHCDPSGGPQSRTLLPIASAWRHLFGLDSAVPLWVGHTPGPTFAVSRMRVLRRRPRRRPGARALDGPELASAFYERAAATPGLELSADPAAGHAIERLWRHVFLPEDEEPEETEVSSIAVR